MKPKSRSNVATIKLGITYYNDGVFNIPVNYNDLISKDNTTIKIDFNGDIKIALIDRNANNNKSPRIRNIGNEYKDWIKKTLSLMIIYMLR
jgi:hypothetical protein